MVTHRRKITRQYIPSRGDICYIGFDPSLGHEQKGARPALVISNTEYTKSSGMALCCPITSAAKGYPFEVPLDTGKTRGVVLVDQVKSLDVHARPNKLLDTCPQEIVNTVCVYLTRLTSEK